LTHEEKIIKYKSQLNNSEKYKKTLHLIQGYLEKIEHELQTLTKEKRYERAVHSATGNFELMLRKIIKSIPDLGTKIKDNDRYQIHFHAFRSWFKTQTTDSQESDFAEALMGHKSLKLKYYRQNSKKRQEVYKKVESALTIADFDKIERDIENIQEKHLEYENRFRKYEKLDRLLQNVNEEKLIKLLDSIS